MKAANAGTTLAVTETPEQVVAILRYVIDGDLAGHTDKAHAAE